MYKGFYTRRNITILMFSKFTELLTKKKLFMENWYHSNIGTKEKPILFSQHYNSVTFWP